jgi:hypothetical protein
MYLQKVISRKTFLYWFFVGVLVNDKNRIHYSEAWIRGFRSVPSHASATLVGSFRYGISIYQEKNVGTQQDVTRGRPIQNPA